jgi:hypothetical protein
MRRIVLVLLALALVTGVAMAEPPALAISGSTGTTVYHDDGSVGVLDADEDVTLAYGPLSLALNAGYTFDMGAAAHSFTFGYTLSASQALGPFTLGASLASNSLTQPVGGAFSGDWLGDMTANIAFAKEAFSANAYTLLTAKAGYPFFMGFDISATYAPKWGSFTLGTTVLDPMAVADDVGYVDAVAAVEGWSIYAKAKVSY